ncbi:aspartyl protease family protein [Marchantia polymorpha subsp. ruderalis]
MTSLRILNALKPMMALLAAVLLLQAAPSRSGKTEGVLAELKHLDHHEDSPLHKADATFAERLHNAVKRSNARIAGFQNIIARGVSPRGADFDPTSEELSRGSSFESPVSSSPGSYFMTISLGSPPQTKTVIVDTGSDLVWLQCAPCTQCFQQSNPVFDPKSSSSYKRIRFYSSWCSELPLRYYDGGFCTYRYGYGDGSTTEGDLATDTLTLTTTEGSKHAVPEFTFGCGDKNRGTFAGADGLVGLGRGALSFNEQIRPLIGSQFSYCLVELSAPATSVLLLGGASTTVGNGLNVKFTPLMRNPVADTFYYVKLNGVKVNNQVVGGIPAGAFTLKRSGSGGVILDSGRTLTYLIRSAYDPILLRLRSLIQYPVLDSSHLGLDLCYDLSGMSRPVFPSVTLEFQGVDLVLPADNLFVRVDDRGKTCLALAGTTDLSIIGNIQQQNHYFLDDVENERVGIAVVGSVITHQRLKLQYGGKKIEPTGTEATHRVKVSRLTDFCRV